MMNHYHRPNEFNSPDTKQSLSFTERLSVLKLTAKGIPLCFITGQEMEMKKGWKV